MPYLLVFRCFGLRACYFINLSNVLDSLCAILIGFSNVLRSLCATFIGFSNALRSLGFRDFGTV